MARGAGFLLLVALGSHMVACRRSTQTKPAPTASTPTPVVPAKTSAAAQPPDAGPPVFQASAATFKNDVLVACVDYAMHVTNLGEAANKAGKTPQELAVEDLRVYLAGGKSLVERVLDKERGPGTAAALRPAGKPEDTQKRCPDQFAGRQVVTKCTVLSSVIGDAGGGAHIGLDVYTYEALGNDKAMRACLAAKGTWWELPKDSLQFRRERNQQLYKRSVEELEKLEKEL